jgi:NAD(P)-dependent dehydrogenase (short-subunit alcohol dehydrogenase family)
MSEQYTGSTVIVTGAAGGLGKAIAEAYLAAGANVAICDVNEERLQATETEWSTNYADKVLTTKTDVTDEASVQALIDAAVQKFGKVDILINNAGIMDSWAGVATCAKASWDSVIGVNLTGTFLCSKAAVSQMLKQGESGGVVLNIASNASIQGLNAGVAYTASKHGVIGVTKNTAGMYGDKNISSMALLLGAMETTNIAESFKKGLDMECMQKVQSSMIGYVPGKTGLDVRDVAKQCLFLTDKSMAPNVNGSCINFNKNWPTA